jgi:hypothetical protein
LNVFLQKLKEKGVVFLDEKGFCKEGLILRIVSNRRDKASHQGFSMSYEGLS